MLRNLLLKLTLKTPSRLNIQTNQLYKDFKNCQTTKISFGEKNKDKVFYIIKRSPGAGFFSNVLFVANHLIICKKKNYIPVVDMQNFPTIYNELNPLKKTTNAWNYYYENLSDVDLNEVYQSKNVIITSNNFEPQFEKDLISKEIKDVFNNEIKPKIVFQKFIECFSKKNFQNYKVLGVHFRGTSYKRSPGHPLPATKKQILKIIKDLILKEKYDKIFLVTEEKNYKEFLVKNFKEKIIFLSSSFRSNSNNAFKIYPRKNHRYKLGREALIEANLLSKCDGLVYVTSNISSAAITLAKDKPFKKYKIDNGINVQNIFISQFIWYLKKILPEKFGGFKLNL